MYFSLQQCLSVIKTEIVSQRGSSCVVCQINTEREPAQIEVVPVIGPQIGPKCPQTLSLSQLKT